MKPQTTTSIEHLRLFFLTALIAIVFFSFVSPHFESKRLGDDSPQVMVSEIEETLGDSEPIVPDDTIGMLYSAFMLVPASINLLKLQLRQEVLPRLNFLYQIRPRSPPVQ